MSERFQVGQRVQTTEGWGIVEEIHDAQKLYPKPPEYPKRYKGQKKGSKFPPGTVVLRVRIDGEPRARNFHETQVGHG